jgi:hypothetical protein
MIKTFLDWKDNDCYLTFTEEDTGKSIEILAAKRGNEAYAKKKRMKAWEIVQGLKRLELDFPVEHSRNIYRNTHLILVTLTFDQRQVTKEEAWRLLTTKGKALNRFSANLSKALGTKATWKVKEATASGYPAPHILVFLDRPIRSFYYRGNWRIQSQAMIERLKRAWPYGFIDVKAVISSRVNRSNVVYYLTKYLTKSIALRSIDDNFDPEQFERERVAILTHIWNKLYRSRDVLSKAFKQRLNSIHRSETDKISNDTIWQLISVEFRKDSVMSRIIREFKARLSNESPV